jgi:tetratricopeptide (TPR) repeat protein
MAEMNCPKCGAEINDTAEFCPACGEPIAKKTESEPPKKKKKTPLILGILAAVIIAAAVGGFFVYKNVIAPSLQYQEAEALFAQSNYEDARQKYQALGNYKDSAGKVTECDYAAACNALENKEYDLAKQMFSELSGYKDSDDLVKRCDYEVALYTLLNEEFDLAKQMFSELSGYQDADDLVKKCDYKKAVAFYNKGDYKDAVETFSSIFDYENSSKFVYSVFKKLAGQDYVDKYTKGISYLTDYLENQKNSFIAFAIAVRLGTTSSTSWSPSLEDKALSNMENCMSEMTAMKKAYDKVFTQAVIDACNDETLRTAHQKFNKLHANASSILTLQKAMDYVSCILNGSTSQMVSDTNTATKTMQEYTAIYNKMQ